LEPLEYENGAHKPETGDGVGVAVISGEYPTLDDEVAEGSIDGLGSRILARASMLGGAFFCEVVPSPSCTQGTQQPSRCIQQKHTAEAHSVAAC
jgi:hypothetical protein